MHIEHVSIWTADIEALRSFYQDWFGAGAGARYENPAKGFASYFLTFDSGPRLELMQRTGVADRPPGEVLGYAHLAISLGGPAEVDRLAQRLQRAGVPLVGGPRRTGDGYYEAVVLDPDGNRIELTA